MASCLSFGDFKSQQYLIFDAVFKKPFFVDSDPVFIDQDKVFVG